MAAPANLIVGWPSTVGSIPAGWSRYTALDAKVPKPAAAGIGTTGGSDTHTHPAASHSHSDTHGHPHGGYQNSVLGGATRDSGPSTGGANGLGGHGHSASLPVANATGLTTGTNSGTSSSGTSIGFARVSVIWIQADGSTNIPTNALAWSAYNPRPSGWNAYANGVNAYLRGAAAGGDGGTLTAAASHNHTFAHDHTHSAGAHTHSNGGSAGGLGAHNSAVSVDATGGLSLDQNAIDHTHNSSGNTASATHNTNASGSDNATSDSQTPDPAYHKLEVVQAAASATTPSGIVALWPNVTPPALWGSCDGTNLTPNLNGTGRYVKGANGVGEIGTTGGSNTHTQAGSHSHTANATSTHSDSGGCSQASAGRTSQGVQNIADIVCYCDHTHPTNATGVRSGSTSTDNQNYSSANHEPAYVQMFFIMLLPVNDTITGVTATATALGKAGVVTAIPNVLIAGAIARATAAGLAAPPRAQPTPDITVLVNDTLGGCSGPIVIRHRFEYWRDFVLVEDVSGAIEEAQIQLDNNRAVVRTARFTIRPSLLPAGVNFSTEHEHLAAFAELLVAGTWVRFPLGVFHVDSAKEHLLPNHQEFWEAQAMDVAGHLWEHELQAPYTIAAGTNYVEAAEALCHSIGLGTDIAPSGFVTPIAFTWPPGKAYGEVINDLMLGINYYPAWASSDGLITSREQLDPFLEATVVDYTTESVPRLIRSPFDRIRESGRYVNQAIVTISTPSRAPATTVVTNDDSDSVVSTVNKTAVTVLKLTGDRTANAALMAAIGASAVRDAAVKAQAATLSTHPDPRRDAHEFYTVTIDDREETTRWRAEGWTYECKTGATMTHRIGRADRVDVTTEVLV